MNLHKERLKRVRPL